MSAALRPSRLVLPALAIVFASCARSAAPVETAPPAPSSLAPPSASSVARPTPPDAVAAETSAPSVDAPPEGMLLVPAGPFTMGADAGGQADERPAHVVDLAAFYLDRTEVTNEAYGECVAQGACRPHDPGSAKANRLGDDAAFRGPRQPVSAISWDDAGAYCRFRGARLPREAEWEKAARGTDGRRFPWGDEPATHERAVFSTGRTSDVGSHPAGAGPYGHVDLAGNVWEWVDDVYDPYAYVRAGAQRGVPGTCDEVLAAQDELRRKGLQGFTGSNPIPRECEHVLRGGAFNYDGPGLRSSNRVHHAARFRLVMSGFRCARDAR